MNRTPIIVLKTLGLLFISALQTLHANAASGTSPPEEKIAEPVTQTSARALPDLAEQRRQQLRHQYPQDELQELKAAGETFSTLWKRELSGQAYGAVLILPGEGQTANWPELIEPMRNKLPSTGWSTLAIDLLTPTPSAIPARAAEKNAAPAGASAENTAQTDTQPTASINQKRTEAALSFLNQQGQYNIVVVAFGNSAARMLNSLSSADGGRKNKEQRQVRALVIINPESDGTTPVDSTLKRFAHPSMPILDLIVGDAQAAVKRAELRRAAAAEARIETYISLQLLTPGPAIFENENLLSRRVRGFLVKHAKGVEVDRR